MRSRWKIMLPVRDLVPPMFATLRRRHMLIPAILAAHAFILAILLLSPSAPTAAPAAASRLSAFDVVAADTLPPAAATPEPARMPAPKPVIDLQAQAPLDASPPVTNASAEASGFGTSCELAGLLGQAIENDPLLRAQLARIGPEARSVANAMMFWDGGWVPIEERAPEDAVALLRQAILDGIKTAPPECLGRDVEGPRFIPVRESSRTMILVLGSATWRWEQLLESEPGGARSGAEEKLGLLPARVSRLAQQQSHQPQHGAQQ